MLRSPESGPGRNRAVRQSRRLGRLPHQGVLAELRGVEVTGEQQLPDVERTDGPAVYEANEPNGTTPESSCLVRWRESVEPVTSMHAVSRAPVRQWGNTGLDGLEHMYVLSQRHG